MPVICEGIGHWPLLETPIAVIDFETTGLRAGPDRVVEASVVRIDPGAAPRLVFDTLIQPGCPVGATFIHGITDADVRDAPRFEQIADGFVDALAGCVVAAYNVYFDMSFLQYELRRLRLPCAPPHLCFMYLRPLLNLGKQCPLEVACGQHGISIGSAHTSAADALATARLWDCYAEAITGRGLKTFADLARLRDYKFLASMANSPLVPRGARTAVTAPLKSRYTG